MILGVMRYTASYTKSIYASHISLYSMRDIASYTRYRIIYERILGCVMICL